MCRLVETIKIENGNILNISYHNERMARSLYDIYGSVNSSGMEKIISIPEPALSGIWKCRVVYDDKTTNIEFLPYAIRSVKSLKTVTADDICYRYKFTERTGINRLFELKGECDDILIIRKGMVTDTSYSNVVFRSLDGNWVTPSSFLLPGTRRAGLLDTGVITEAVIRQGDINKYSEVRLINAMIGLEDSTGIPIENIL